MDPHSISFGIKIIYNETKNEYKNISLTLYMNTFQFQCVVNIKESNLDTNYFCNVSNIIQTSECIYNSSYDQRYGMHIHYDNTDNIYEPLEIDQIIIKDNSAGNAFIIDYFCNDNDTASCSDILSMINPYNLISLDGRLQNGIKAQPQYPK